MATKETAASAAGKISPPPFLFTWGQERTDAAMAMQKAVMDSYEQASRAWLARVQSEISLWSDLAEKLSKTHSIPEALESYSKCVSERMQMAAEDGRRLVEESQQLSQKIAHSLGNGWQSGST